MKQLLCLLLGLIFSLSLFGQTTKAVIETTLGPDVEPELNDLFMNALSNGLTNSGQFQVIANRQEYAQKIQGEIDAQESGYIDDSQQLSFGRANGAQLVIYIKISTFDNKYFITVNMIELESGVSKKTLDPILADRSNIVDKALELAKRLSSGGVANEEKQIEVPGVECPALPGGRIDRHNRPEKDWREATSICESIGPGWRLPTLDELKSIMTIVKNQPDVYGSRFYETTYWTSTKRNSASAFSVEYPSCTTTFESLTSEAIFRCIYTEELFDY